MSVKVTSDSELVYIILIFTFLAAILTLNPIAIVIFAINLISVLISLYRRNQNRIKKFFKKKKSYSYEEKEITVNEIIDKTDLSDKSTLIELLKMHEKEGKNIGEIMRNIPKNLLNNKLFIKDLIIACNYVYIYIDEDFKKDKDLALLTIEQNRYMYKFFYESIKCDPEISFSAMEMEENINHIGLELKYNEIFDELFRDKTKSHDQKYIEFQNKNKEYIPQFNKKLYNFNDKDKQIEKEYENFFDEEEIDYYRIETFLKEHKQSNPEVSTYLLGKLYIEMSDEDLKEVDYHIQLKRGYELIFKAIDFGVIDAYIILGRRYHRGDGVLDKNISIALSMYKEVYKYDRKRALSNIAELYSSYALNFYMRLNIYETKEQREIRFNKTLIYQKYKRVSNEYTYQAALEGDEKSIGDIKFIKSQLLRFGPKTNSEISKSLEKKIIQMNI